VSRWSLARVVVVVSVGLILFILVIFLAALGMALADASRWGPRIAIFRDISLLVLATIGTLLIASIAILIVQLARFIQSLRRDMRLILQQTQATANEAKNTIEFVSDHVAEPVIQANSFFAGFVTFLKEIFALWKLLRYSDNASDEDEALRQDIAPADAQ